jgi:hypothetical protein
MTGIIAGFSAPEIVEGLNIPGFHLHAISMDRTYGGDVLDLILENATVERDITPGFRMDLPVCGDFMGMDLTGEFSGELAVVEQGTDDLSLAYPAESATLIENYFADTGKRRDLDRFGQMGGMKGKNPAGKPVFRYFRILPAARRRGVRHDHHLPQHAERSRDH